MMGQDLFHYVFAVFRIEISERVIFNFNGLNQDTIKMKK